MKIAFFSESTADDEALRILVAGILGEEIEYTDLPNNLRFRSSSHFIRDLPAVIRSVHYASEAEALVAVSDSDDTPVHIESHNENIEEACKLCQVRRIVRENMANLKVLLGKGRLKVAIGVPVPAIEAWYVCGLNGNANEATWMRVLGGGKIPYNRKILKAEVYGTDKPPLILETEHAVRCAQRLVSNLTQLEQLFPQGFGTFADEIRNWKQ